MAKYKLAQIFLLFTTVVFLAGCTEKIEVSSDNNGKSKPKVDLREKNSQKECEEAGGMWEVAGMSEESQCFNRYSDGGKQCNSYKDCQGSCIYEKERNMGVCSSSDYPYGCRSEFENGKILPELCTD